jgi:hypothetical protein
LTTEKLFTIIKDGQWHNLTDLSVQVKVQPDKLTEFFQFLSAQGVIKYEEETGRVKIEPEWQNLLPTVTEPPAAPTKNPSKPDALGLKK